MADRKIIWRRIEKQDGVDAQYKMAVGVYNIKKDLCKLAVGV